MISIPLSLGSSNNPVILYCGYATKAVSVEFTQFFEPAFVEFLKECDDPQKIVAVGSRFNLEKLRFALRDSKNPAIDNSLSRSIDVIITD
jgi:hypothetical protein